MEVQEGPGALTQEAVEAVAQRPVWNNKLEYILAQMGFSVGLGTIWRFPYLCYQNGGGTFLFLYILLLFTMGTPLLFMEMALGQHLNSGCVGVWSFLHPRLRGVGFASCLVSSMVALYYNVIIAWSIFYLSQSFRSPLPWGQCPRWNSTTLPDPECSRTTPTTYFWYRETLQVTDSVSEGGGLVLSLSVCLFVAWFLVVLFLIQGIKSIGKILYFSVMFPYIVLLCFLIWAYQLEGSANGLRYLLTMRMWPITSMTSWRQVGTHLFFALGLGSGSIIAFASYTPRHNNCTQDAVIVALINLGTSLLTTQVLFSILGFRASVLTRKCGERNAWKIQQLIGVGELPRDVWPPGSLSKKPANTYNMWLSQLSTELSTKVLEHVPPCNVETEFIDDALGPGLVFLVFTEALTMFSGSSFWSVIFFLMLINLGLNEMVAIIQGILTSLQDAFPHLRQCPLALTMTICFLGFLGGLLFTQRSGIYLLNLFDDFSATLSLFTVVIFENIGVTCIYGVKRFLEDIRTMVGYEPSLLYYYLLRYTTLLGLGILLIVSLSNLGIKQPSYYAWDSNTSTEVLTVYPVWALSLLLVLFTLPLLPIPIVLLQRSPAVMISPVLDKDNLPGGQ